MLGISTSVQCPRCQRPLEAGEFFVQFNPRGRRMFGLWREHLWFRPFNQPVELALKSQSRSPGFRCSSCGLLVIDKHAASAS